MTGYRFEKFDKLTILGRRWFFRFVAPNHEKMNQSEGYNSAAARDHAIEVLKRESAKADVVDA